MLFCLSAEHEAFKLLGQIACAFETGKFEKVTETHSYGIFSSLLEVVWGAYFNFAFKPSWSIKFSDKHPWCTYDLVFCGLPFKESTYISKSAKEAKLDFGCHADQ